MMMMLGSRSGEEGGWTPSRNKNKTCLRADDLLASQWTFTNLGRWDSLVLADNQSSGDHTNNGTTHRLQSLLCRRASFQDKLNGLAYTSWFENTDGYFFVTSAQLAARTYEFSLRDSRDAS